MNKPVCEEQVYRSIFEDHSTSLHSFLYYKGGDQQLAEDIVQETFLRLWKNCAKVIPEKVKSFLFTTANRLLLDQFKHQKVVLRYQQQPHAMATTEDPGFLLEVEEFKTQLMAAIQKLPEKSRVVFLMNRIDKLTYKEIAERLGLSQKAVEKRMHRALVQLRETIHQPI